MMFTFDEMSEDDSEDDEGHNVGVRKLQQAQDGDEDCLTDQVNDATDALVVAVVLQAPLVPGQSLSINC